MDASTDASQKSDAATDAMAACSGGETLCNGQCVDEQVNPNNCGACGTVCPTGETCGNGKCVLSCSAPEIDCNGTCVNPNTDNTYCGATSNASNTCTPSTSITSPVPQGGITCPSGTMCNGAGVCASTCTGTTVACNGACVDASNPATCGATGGGATCASGTTATGGGTNCAATMPGSACTATTTDGGTTYACACPVGDTLCPEGTAMTPTCVDPQTSITNCGATPGGACDSTATDAGYAGQVCVAPLNSTAVCVNGTCSSVCNTGFATCGGPASAGCTVDLNNDSNNCGTCGNVCYTGACTNGACPPCVVTGLNVQPTPFQSITVNAGQTSPTVTFTALLNCSPVSAAWNVDLGNVATISGGASSSGVLVPTGQAGGLVTVTASYNGATVQRQVFIQLVASQNGSTGNETGQVPTSPGQITAGGGVGGVGGTGLGAPVTNQGTLTALGNPTSTGQAQGLSFLYPYNATVWPRGMLAPLIMWTWQPGNADAIQIQLSTTTGSFSYTGTFGPPPILQQLGGSFVNMPIPQDVWAMATNTAGGTDQLTLSLTVAKGGVGYGPISETWTIAPAQLSGIIYYQSYGTQLVQNEGGAIGGNGEFGGAILSIHAGDTAPTVTAGTNTMTSGCRVCHSVGAAGSMLVVQHGDNYGASSAYSLGASGNTEHVMTHNAAPYGDFPPAMYADGSMALSGSGQLLPLPTDTTPIATTGMPATNLGQPAFSPDGTKVVFNPQSGTLTNNQTLYVMTFNKATMSFSAATLVASDVGSASQVKPGWPAFFPDSKSIVYHHQVLTGIENDLGTRAGNQAQIYWTSVTSSGSVTPMAKLNGVGYLPKLATPSTMKCTADGYQVAATPSGSIQPNLDHSQDATMNYEPTVNPIASGGYAWVVFTSRRMYGNVAAIPPYCSDPRGVNLAVNTANPLATNITTKKLWVAAIDLSQAAGTDSSHPAFYLPGQELIAGNSRGFWSLDPCTANGSSCQIGDQCCGGYCEANGSGNLVCGSSSGGNCSGVGNKCTTATDCCDTTNLCVNGFCTVQ